MTDNQQNERNCAEKYVVKRGDSFYLIAHKLGVPLRDLLASNRDIHPARLMVGDVLCIPRKVDADEQPPAPEEAPQPEAPNCPLEQQYSVENGQTVADIQLRSLLSRHTLQSANPTVDLDQLKDGQVLCVPKENVPCPLPNTVVMAEGETLETLAQKYGLSIGNLLRANPCLAPQDFEAGTPVIIPAK